MYFERNSIYGKNRARGSEICNFRNLMDKNLLSTLPLRKTTSLSTIEDRLTEDLLRQQKKQK